ncbi:Rab-GTPase-TBC domain-containing protein [Spironucleus salmonicida]|uniref:Rab-GTPase-TBC domain-containing protein n=1 Tax=Spironucleus salmonicida TaxID=348837 RepID=V6LSP2_9EUKA|nr:Rab-GTPase-TBC domain-containing protein [Spironucleus salmonicida]|eukprot:EST46701.1 TBC and transmembrane domain-containing protein [Spironucleus salmonicida]
MDYNSMLDKFSKQQLDERLIYLKDTKPEIITPQLNQLDQYGFIQSNSKSKQSQIYYSTLNVQDIQSSHNSDKKVQHYLNTYKKLSASKQYDLLKQICRNGIPNNYRNFFWQQALHSFPSDNETIESREQVYSELLGQGIEDIVIIQINKDIDRTMPSIQYFYNPSMLQALFRVLKAYASYNIQISYCQGMGFIAAIFIYYMTEIDSFYAFKVFMDKFNDMYRRDMKGTHIRCEVFEKLIQKLFPTAFKAIQKNQINFLFAAPWFMTLFSYSLPFPVLLRVLDMIFCEGEKALFRAAIALIQQASYGLVFHLPKNVSFNSDNHSELFDKFRKNAGPQHDNISIINMPEIDCRLALQGIGSGIKNQNQFIQSCLKIKFKSCYLQQLIDEAKQNFK